MEETIKLIRPWLTIWVQPKKTIRQIIETDPTYLVIPLAVLAGVAQTLSNAIGRSAGDLMAWPFLILFILILGPIGGVFSLYFGGAILRWVGTGYLGGSATHEEVRAALAWSSIPQIFGVIPSLLLILIMGAEAFTTETPRFDALIAGNAVLALLFLLLSVGIIILSLGLGLWNLVLLSICLGEVNGFSSWRGFGNVMLPILVIGVPLFICGLLIALSTL